MADQFLGEIRMVGFNFAPTGWALCNGQTMAISQNAALFALLGTQFGGNGTSTFALPNMQSCAPINQGQGPGLSDYVIGELTGTENVTLLSGELPLHSHTFGVSTAHGTLTSPSNAVLAVTASGAGRNPEPGNLDFVASTSVNTTMSPNAVGTAGGNVPHTNIQPFLTINFIIALTGIFPSRS
jgi:microcystin-dependent protein